MKRRADGGYTILEVMIFLMISGFMFATAVVAVSGTQDEARYSQTVRDLEIQVKDTINDVANGYYPDYERGRCNANPAGISFNNSVLGDVGGNAECVSIGKVIMPNLTSSPVENSFGVGTIIGVNPGIDDSLSLSLTGLQPTLAYKSGGTHSLDLTVYKPIRYGARITKIGANGSNQQYSSLSFISDFSNTSGASDTRASGTLTTNVYGFKGLITSSNSLEDYRDDIEDFESTSSPLPYDKNLNNGFYICLLTTDDRRAKIIVGVDGVVTATKTEFDVESIANGGNCP